MAATKAQIQGLRQQAQAVVQGMYPQAFPVRDYIVLQGMKSPGRCTIRGAGTPRNWQKHSGFGVSGAWVAFMGNDLSAFEVDFYLWDRLRHPAAWQAFSHATLTLPGKKATPLTIEHPILHFPPLAIRQVIVTDVLQPEQDETGGWTITVKFEQYAKPQANKVKNTDTPNGEEFGPPFPKTQAQRDNFAKTTQLANLKNGTDKSGLL
jgi:hypothetical protein